MWQWWWRWWSSHSARTISIARNCACQAFLLVHTPAAKTLGVLCSVKSADAPISPTMLGHALPPQAAYRRLSSMRTLQLSFFRCNCAAPNPAVVHTLVFSMCHALHSLFQALMEEHHHWQQRQMRECAKDNCRATAMAANTSVAWLQVCSAFHNTSVWHTG